MKKIRKKKDVSERSTYVGESSEIYDGDRDWTGREILVLYT